MLKPQIKIKFITMYNLYINYMFIKYNVLPCTNVYIKFM